MENYENVKHYLKNHCINFASMEEIKAYVNYINGYDEAIALYDEEEYLAEYLIDYTICALNEDRFLDASCYANMLAEYFKDYHR